jgi:hypothetical protein
MIVNNTPVEDYFDQYGLLVKREDLCCPPPGPPFSKTRGVFAHVKNRPEEVIGVLDTYHSQAGHAVAQACALLGKTCINYYPDFKNDPGPRNPQLRALSLGAYLQPLPAGRSAILYHRAKKDLARANDSYMMPNALKLPEMVSETAAEVARTIENGSLDILGDDAPVLIAISSGTIAAGVIKGFTEAGQGHRRFILHQGYDRPQGAVLRYVQNMAGIPIRDMRITLINEGYGYKDVARQGETPPWPCNPYYDLKAFRWWLREGRDRFGSAIMWNIG